MAVGVREEELDWDMTRSDMNLGSHKPAAHLVI